MNNSNSTINKDKINKSMQETGDTIIAQDDDLQSYYDTLLMYSKEFQISADVVNFNVPTDLIIKFLDVRNTFVLRLQIADHMTAPIRFQKPSDMQECVYLAVSTKDEVTALIYFLYFLGFKNKIISQYIDSMLARLS